jgi:hypothetical protein
MAGASERNAPVAGARPADEPPIMSPNSPYPSPGSRSKG